MVTLFLPVLASLFGTAQALEVTGEAPPPSGLSPAYQDCATLTDFDVNAAAEHAREWIRDGGGNAARHCLAVALLGQGKSVSAANILMDLAKAEKDDPGVTIRLYLQAAEAFMDGGRKEHSMTALRAAYAAAPDSPQVHLTAATLYATAQDWYGVEKAILGLERHLDLSADAYALRGRARFEMGRYPDAASDTAAALMFDPLLVDALVLRGDLAAKGVVLPTRR